METEYIKPQKVTGLDMAFGGDTKKLLPAYDSLPEEFRREKHEYCKLVSKWFFGGLSPQTEFTPREGVDVKDALGHVKAVLGSFEPKHEHKTAGVAYLLDQFFVSINNWEQ